MPDVMKVWIAGPRAWENPKPVKAVVRKLEETYGRNKLLILEGGAPGVDTLARKAGCKFGVHVVQVGALWDFYGRAAGPNRNRALTWLRPQLLIAFYFREKLIDHRGTFSAVTMAHGAKIPVKYVHRPAEVAMPSSVHPDSPMGNRARAANGQPPRPKKQRRKR